MRVELEDYKRELEKDGHPPLAMGIGLHRGIGVAGLVASKDLIQYALVGSTINIAARVQDLTRLHDVDIMQGSLCSLPSPKTGELPTPARLLSRACRPVARAPVPVYRKVNARYPY